MSDDYIQEMTARDHLGMLPERIEELAKERDEAWKRAAHAEEMWGKAEVKLAKANDRIQGLKELLWAAEKDANEAEDYAEELEAKLAKAVEALELARPHVANNAQGWSVGRAASRADLTTIDDTLAELTGGKDG